MKFRAGLALATVSLGLFTAGAAVAGPLIVPVGALSSSDYPGYVAANAIDQGPGSELSDWSSLSQGILSKLGLDLGAVYALSSFSLTDRVTSGGGNNGFHGGLTDFTTSFTLQAFADASFTTPSSALFSFSKSAPTSPSSPAAFGYSDSIAGLTGRYIQYSVTGTAGGQNVGLSNIVFGAVPEPATWGMMLFGFAAMGGAMRYRRRNLAVSYS